MHIHVVSCHAGVKLCDKNSYMCILTLHLQDDTFINSHITTIGVDFVSRISWTNLSCIYTLQTEITRLVYFVLMKV